MPTPISISDALIAREFRLQRCHGSAIDAITNPIVRRCLEMGARVRAEREAAVQPSSTYRDVKSRAANDND